MMGPMPAFSRSISDTTTSPSHCAEWIDTIENAANLGVDQDVVVDIANVKQVSSAELSRLIQVRLQLQADGRRLVLVNAQRTILNVFTITRLHQLIDIRAVETV